VRGVAGVLFQSKQKSRHVRLGFLHISPLRLLDAYALQKDRQRSAGCLTINVAEQCLTDPRLAALVLLVCDGREPDHQKLL